MHRSIALVLGIAAVLAIAGPTSAKARKPAALPAPDPAVVAAALRDKALADPAAYDFVAALTTEVGQRLAGTSAAERAKDWALARLTAMGFQNVHAEPFTITAWQRGEESAEVLAPYPQKLQLIGLGRSPSTPPGGIEAEIALFHSYADLLAAPEGSLAGKIAVVTQPMTRAQDGSGYGVASTWRTRGAGEAAKRGAVAYLVRSISTAETRPPHAGAMSSTSAVIPAAALGVPDAELLDRMVAEGKPVRLHLVLQSTSTPGAPAWNVSGEVTGSEKPGEIVLIGGHLDSWDPGQGAIDDGAGDAITVGAASLINKLARHPRRTIRVVLFGAEELDFSGKAYGDAHAAEVPRMVVTAESDNGADPEWSLQLPANSVSAPALKPLASLLAPLKIVILPQPATIAGADVAELELAGAPAFSLRQDASRYFDIHHSAEDTLDKIDPAGLAQSVAAWSILVYLIADSDIDFRALAAAAPPAAPGRP